MKLLLLSFKAVSGWLVMQCRKGLLTALVLLGCWLPSSTIAAAKKLTLLTLEWPPYTSNNLPDKGFISKRVLDAYSTMGFEAVPGFFNWRDAVNLHYTDTRFTALYPVYPTKERKKVCNFSDPIGSSQLGLAQRNIRPLTWRKIEDLKKYRIGLVDGYGNEDELDRLVQEGKVVTVKAASDTDNLIHLAKKRIDAAVIDQAVFNWLIKNDARLIPYRKQLQMNKRLLTTWSLHVCFRPDSKGNRLKKQFNKGLAKLQQASYQPLPHVIAKK